MKNKASINFSGILTLLITLAIMIFSGESTFLQYYPEWYVIWYTKWVNWITGFVFISMYFMLALSSGDADGIALEISQAASNLTNKYSDMKEKLVFIKSQLEKNTDKYDRIFTRGKFRPNRTLKEIVRDQLKIVGFRIYYGSIDIRQAGWMCAYSAYVFFIKMDYFQIDMPYSIMIVIACIFGLQLSSVNISGMGELLADIIKEANEAVSDPRQNLNAIISNIRTLCSMYNVISKRIESISGMNTLEFINQANKLNQNVVLAES